MAPVNPQIPETNAFNPFGYIGGPYKPTGVIEPKGVEPNTIRPQGVQVADQSGEYAGKAIAAAISGVATEIDFAGKVSDTLIKQDIDKRLFQSIDAERLRYTADLEKALAPGTTPVAGSSIQPDITNTTTKQTAPMIANVNQLSGNTPVTTEIPAGAPGGSPPPAVLQSELPQQLNTLSDAMANGKISPTFYYGRLNEIAKQFRQQYPGYRDYIDQQVHQITGVTPANAYITSLTQRINTGITNAQTEREHVLSFLRRDSVISLPNGYDLINGYSSGRYTAAQVYQSAGTQMAIKHSLELAKLQREDAKGNVEFQGFMQGKQFDELSSKISSATFSDLELAVSGGSPQKLMNYLTDVASGKQPKPDDTTIQQLNQLVGAKQEQYKAQLRQAALAVGYTDPEEIKKKVDAQAAITFGPLLAQINNGDFGAAGATTRFIAAVGKDDTYKLLTSTDSKEQVLARHVRMAQIGKLTGGDQFVQSLVTSASTVAGLNAAVQSYMTHGMQRMATQPDKDNTGVTFTVDELIKDAQGKGVATPQVVDRFVGMVKAIGQKSTDGGPPDEIKKNLIRAMFEKNILNMPWVDRNKQDMSYTILQRMTQPDIRDEIYRLGRQDQSLTRLYNDWVDQSFKIQFSKEMNTLKDIQAYPGMSLHWHSDPSNNNYGWRLWLNGQDITQKDLRDPLISGFRRGRGVAEGGVAGITGIEQVQTAQRVVNNLNSGLQPIVGVAAKNPGFDVEGYLLQSFKSAGVDLTKASGIPAGMIEAIRKAREGAEEKAAKWKGKPK